MGDFSVNSTAQYVKLGCGALLVLLGVFLAFFLESSETARLADLETDGVVATATVTKMDVSPVQAARRSTIGTYTLMRGLGASRKAAIGTALITRSNARSAARAAARQGYYDIEFELPMADGQIFMGADHLLIPRTDSLDVGSRVSVLYSARDPGVHRLPSYSEPASHVPVLLKVGVAAVGLALGAALIWWGLQQSAGTASVAAPTSSGRVFADAPSPRFNAVARASGPVSTVRPIQVGTTTVAPRGFGVRARG